MKEREKFNIIMTGHLQFQVTDLRMTMTMYVILLSNPLNYYNNFPTLSFSRNIRFKMEANMAVCLEVTIRSCFHDRPGPALHYPRHPHSPKLLIDPPFPMMRFV